MHQDQPHRPGTIGAAAEPSPGPSDTQRRTATHVPHDDGDESHLIRGYD